MQHKFVEFIPSEIEENVLYISIEYDVAKHKCACGCGVDIVTSLSPARWRLTYDGETVSLSPSIGNWSHPCKSHYFITNDKVLWSGPISEGAIRKVVKNDQESLKRHIKKGTKENRVINILKKLFSF
ncbi:hypothetical protein J7E81_08945 [Bacillus sp. ISL-18]|uniref:DUF6527 family protein n=1 Tax=Bacillus sp. ISL-18 TaxID=2819118 RepID=UPI001BE9E467|nr:DUF6527 family protein [Bacillus sp. ISL-18]MBT2655362.1 hypothetical protein [Bacillus sp. ISL-18]